MIVGTIEAWSRFWFSEASLLRLAAFRIIILAIAAWELWRCGPTFLADGCGRDEIPHLYREYQPLYLLELFGIDPPGAAVASGVLLILIGSIVLGIVGLLTRTSLVLASLLSLYVYAVVYSYGQAHHDKIALGLALIVLPLSPAGYRLSIDRLFRRIGDPHEQRQFAGWAIRFVQVSIALGYSAAGITKLIKGGLEWMNGYSLQAIFLSSDMPLAELAASSLAMTTFLSVSTILLQATFPICLFIWPLRWIYIPSIVAFHFGNWLIVGTEHQVGMWGVVLAAFIPLDKVLVRLKQEACPLS